MMKELMMNEDLSDVTLVTEDKKQIKAHINILSACSPVFNEILTIDKNSSPIVYLRGIQYPEMESIIQFIYHGEATFHEERMDEFLSVAKSLEIKEICKAETESKHEPEDYPLPNNQDVSTHLEEEHTVISDKKEKQAPQERQRYVVNDNGIFECDQCLKTYSSSGALCNHKQSVHRGVKYCCDQCDYQATQKCDLYKHIQSRHEGVKYACDQCDYQASQQGHLSVHIQAKHEGIKHACDQCDQQFTQRSSLLKHIKNKHDV